MSLVLLLRKGGGAENVLAMLKGGRGSFDVVLTRELEVLAIVMGGGMQKFYPVLRGGVAAQKVSDKRFSHFVASPPHN